MTQKSGHLLTLLLGTPIFQLLLPPANLIELVQNVDIPSVPKK